MFDLSKINLEWLRTFWIVARTKNMSKAADILCVTQPAISRTIKQLEERTSYQLFIRKGRALELTEAGEMLLLSVRKIFEELNIASIRLDKTKEVEQANIRIGTTHLVLRSVVLPVLRNFFLSPLSRKIKFQIQTQNMKELIQQLQESQLDICFVTAPQSDVDEKILIPSELEFLPLIGFRWVFATNPKEYPQLLGRKISAEELNKYPLVVLKDSTFTRTVFDDFFRNKDQKANVKLECDMMSAVVDCVSQGIGIGCIVDVVAESNHLVALDTDLLSKRHWFGALFKKASRQNVAVQNLLESLQ